MDIRLLSEYVQEVADDRKIRFSDDAIVSLNDAVNDALRDLIQVRKLIGFNRLGSHGDSKELSSLCPSFWRSVSSPSDLWIWCWSCCRWIRGRRVFPVQICAWYPRGGESGPMNVVRIPLSFPSMHAWTNPLRVFLFFHTGFLSDGLLSTETNYCIPLPPFPTLPSTTFA